MRNWKTEKPWNDMHSWLCRCYGPNWFRRSDFDYWVRKFFHNGINTSSIRDSLIFIDWISVSNSGEVRMKNCEECQH